MKEYEKYITTRLCDQPAIQINYIDYNDLPQIDLSQPTNGGLPNLTLQIYSKSVLLNNANDSLDIKKIIVNKIVELANVHYNEIKDKFSLSLNGSYENNKITTKIGVGSNYIACMGRIGPATNILVSSYNYDRYDLEYTCKLLNLEVLIDDSVEDLILYRKSSPSQTGLFLCYMEIDKQKLREKKLNRILRTGKKILDYDKFALVPVGFHPEKQFLKILC